MTSPENVEIVRQAWEGWIRGDARDALRNWDPQVVVDMSHWRDWPEAEYHGIERVERFMTEWRDMWDDYEAGLDDVIAASDGRVVSLYWHRGRGRDSGLPMEFKGAIVMTLRAGKVVRATYYDDRTEALRAVGLPAQPLPDPVQVVRGLYDALTRGDDRAALDAFHPDVEWDGRNIPDGTLARGRQAVADHAAHWALIWQDWTVAVEELTQVTDDTVIAYTRERGRSEAGVVMDERHAEVYVVRGDKIVRRVGFSDPADALPAVRAPAWR